MPVQISLKKSTTDPNGASGLTLGEPVFNYSNKTFWMGLGGSTAPVWIGAGICGASAAIASGTAYTIPTVGSVRDYFIGVSGSFLPSTTGYVSSFNGRTGAVQGVSSAAAGTGISISAATGAITITNTGVQTFNGLTGAVTGVTVGGANTFTALNSFNAGISAAGATLSANTRIPAGATLTVDGNIVANGNVSLGNATSDTITSAADITVNSLTVGKGGGGVSTNTAVGVGALVSNSTGSFNTAIGNTALTANTTGSSNIAVGDGALNANTTGSFNTAFGRRALLNNNGSSNTAAGQGALSNLSAGSFNTAIGRLTGNGVITATGGIYIGYSNIGTDLSTNEIVIGAQVVGFGSNTAVIGATTQTAAYIYGLVNAMGGVSAAGATLNGTVTAPTPAIGTNNTQVATTAFVQNEIVADTVTTFNGRTGAVQGVSSAAAGTGISISAATGAITITNTGVQTFNGLTGAVTGVTVGGANTFTALNSFAVGISSNGGTFSANTRFLSGIQTDSVLSTTGAGGNVYINSDSYGNGGNSVTFIGDWNNDNNGTSITVDDQGGTIYLNGSVNNTTSISSPRYSDDYSSIRTYQTTTSATTANQTIATVEGVYDSSQIPEVMGWPAFEVTISARDTVLNKTEMLKMLVVQNGTDTVNTQYGLIRTGLTGPVQSYSTTLQNTAGVKDLLIRATPSSANSTKFNVTVRAHNA